MSSHRTSPSRTKPHLELRSSGGSGLWEQGYAAGYQDGEAIGRKRADEHYFWAGFCVGIVLAGLIVLVGIYEMAIR